MEQTIGITFEIFHEATGASRSMWESANIPALHREFSHMDFWCFCQIWYIAQHKDFPEEYVNAASRIAFKEFDLHENQKHPRTSLYTYWIHYMIQPMLWLYSQDQISKPELVTFVLRYVTNPPKDLLYCASNFYCTDDATEAIRRADMFTEMLERYSYAQFG